MTSLTAEEGTKTSTSTGAATASPSTTIHLEASEEQLFHYLLEAVQSYQSTHNNSSNNNKDCPSITLRVAGGWVRDKLLQRENDDLDIAVDTISGVQLAELLALYLKRQNVPHSSLGIISANPEQSKHLETATLRILNFELDLCQLRSHELYNDDTRIPIVQRGTPAQDAQRRDFTLNSLFYNLHTRQIEDYCGGLQDLQDKLLTTPLDPLETFRDDPLRVLRAIRFGVRYNLHYDPSLVEAATTVAESLSHKVSRERIGKELEGMLSGKHARPAVALRTLCDWNLANVVFALPSNLDASNNEATTNFVDWWKRGLDYLDRASARSPLPPGVDSRLLLLCSFLAPLRQSTYMVKHNKAQPTVQYIVKESIKFKNKDAAQINLVLQTVDQVPLATSNQSRLEWGRLLRTAKELWKLTVVLSGILNDDTDVTTPLLEFGESLGPVWTMKPALNGNELRQQFGISGPVIAEYIAKTIDYQLEHPDYTKESVLEYLRQQEEASSQRKRKDLDTSS